MPLIIELSHGDYPTHQVSRYESDVASFLSKEKSISLSADRRAISKDYLIKMLERYEYAKIYDRKGNCIGGVFYADDLMTVEERNKHERNKAFGIA